MKVEIVDIKQIQAATPKGTMETRQLVYFRVDDGPTQTIEVSKATLTQQDARDAIATHLKYKSGIVGVYEV